MDFGATVCMPINPYCNNCQLQFACEGYKNGLVNRLPVKEKTLLKKHRWFYYFIIQHNNNVLVEKRILKDIWENLYEFYLLESNEQINWEENSVKEWFSQQFVIDKVEVISISSIQKQQLTHQLIKGQFINVIINCIPKQLMHYQWITQEQLVQLPFPKYINQYTKLHKTIQ